MLVGCKVIHHHYRAFVTRNFNSQHHSDNAYIWSFRGEALCKLGNYQEGFENCNRALKYDPNCDLAFYSRACYYALQGKNELALDNLEKAIDLDPTGYLEDLKTDSAFDNLRKHQHILKFTESLLSFLN